MSEKFLPRFALIASVGALCLTFVPAASAAKSGGAGRTSGSSSLELVMVNDVNGNGLPNWGDTVTFKVSTTATTTPEVRTVCYQKGTEVYYHVGGFYSGDPWAPGDQMFRLDSYLGTSEPGECTATLFSYTPKKGETNLAHLSFQVLP